ncbi:MAG: aminotransferase [Candidatus Improbicoccus devescovinae]|nr:MAG: aminotransferase [Candidatus Improbicoccus devescovinae]
MNYFELSTRELDRELEFLQKKFTEFQSKEINLDMSRGKPCAEQLILANEMLSYNINNLNFVDSDILNYGCLEGLYGARMMMSVLMDCEPQDVIIGGNSSLCLMSDVIEFFFTIGINGEKWEFGNTKFLAPVPGYDRHFQLSEHFGIELIPVSMQNDGPDMNLIEDLVENDENIKGLWCVPKFSNPSGITYSENTIKRLARLKPKSKNFRIFWDNAYSVHSFAKNCDINLANIFDACISNHNQNLVISFCSTSKMTFAGGGIAAIGCKDLNFKNLLRHYSFKTIGFDKINQARHVAFFSDNQKKFTKQIFLEKINKHMSLHADILRPKFELVLEVLDKKFADNPIISCSSPKGGYFIIANTFGSAKRTVDLCSQLGLNLTAAGVMFPYKNDPRDSTIRIAPSYPPLEELAMAIEIFSLCVRISCIEKLLKK